MVADLSFPVGRELLQPVFLRVDRVATPIAKASPTGTPIDVARRPVKASSVPRLTTGAA
jgi:hypothetical protein